MVASFAKPVARGLTGHDRQDTGPGSEPGSLDCLGVRSVMRPERLSVEPTFLAELPPMTGEKLPRLLNRNPSGTVLLSSENVTLTVQ